MDPKLAKQIYDLMVKSRELELRMISMVRTGDAHFWIGGPGEEAFNVALGLLIHKGEGIEYDYLLFHYRNS
ncbi:MAG: thiamine pyrophosphate-dependent dehydrogenase E1 component subunit alpha, partial [Spirochaetia bacterium]|nr:thiamine pyrophosphate-dependent dehydrogenase E1 component subunit alpha [Spirochaetia bacterium]